jgi:hypothetical protein
MVEIYEGHGFTREEAQTVLGIMSRHKEFFVDHMMVQELGILPPSDESPFKQGLAMFLSFVAFGVIPLLSYLAFSTIKWPTFNALFLLACVLTGIALFVLGVIGSRFTHLAWWQGGLQVFFSGSMAAIISYVTGLMCVSLSLFWGLSLWFLVLAGRVLAYHYSSPSPVSKFPVWQKLSAARRGARAKFSVVDSNINNINIPPFSSSLSPSFAHLPSDACSTI